MGFVGWATAHNILGQLSISYSDNNGIHNDRLAQASPPLGLFASSPKLKRNLKKLNMISVLAQERLLGFALGSAITGFVVFEQRKCIYGSISDYQSHDEFKSQRREPIFAKKSLSEFAHFWNKAVDQTFGPVIESVSSRRW